MTPSSTLRRLGDSARFLRNKAHALKSNAMATKTKQPTKSQRVRDYLAANPSDGNTDVVAALAKYGVKYGDVTSVKNQLKKQAGTPGIKSGKRATKAAATKVIQNGSTGAAKTNSAAGSGLPAVQTGVRFVDEAGGVDQAMEILTLIRAVRGE